MSPWLMVTLMSALAGCASAPSGSNGKTAIRQMMKQDVGEINTKVVNRILTEAPAEHHEAQIAMQRKVWWWLHYYTVRDRARFTRNLERGENYRPLVQQILRLHDLPTELYYLAMIESGYVTHASSAANAVGIWQFMRPTALHYGLGVNGKLDERLHPVAATHAAANYLSDLYRQFDSWYLAIAAYNAGQGRIHKAVQRAHTKDFWKLVERKMIPKETMEYIPKFLAAATIGQNLDTFGFKIKPSNQQWPEIAPVVIKLKDVRKFKIAKISGVDEAELNRLNPQLKQALARTDVRAIRVWLPKDAAQKFAIPQAIVAVKDKKKRNARI